ncbi:MAG: urease accessory protein UreF [Methylococcales bacterium]|nr:urease accessory protein UreF [Methylococcales bacterium]MDD5632446.1 urease accessory protein UreF [Methylococcales bacterium]
MVTDLALLRLLQLVSPGLPIGMYSYSQGFERAVDDGWISNAADAGEWIGGLMDSCLARIDLPILVRLYDAWACSNVEQVDYWSRTLMAFRETAELRAEDRQTGQALARLLDSMAIADMQLWIRKPEATLATIFSFAAVNWGIPKRETTIGYLWSWLENQVLCAVKLVPLGQVAGQRLLTDLAGKVPAIVDEALNLADIDIGGSAFGLALASSRHEIQYSRLFRS